MFVQLARQRVTQHHLWKSLLMLKIEHWTLILTKLGPECCLAPGLHGYPIKNKQTFILICVQCNNNTWPHSRKILSLKNHHHFVFLLHHIKSCVQSDLFLYILPKFQSCAWAAAPDSSGSTSFRSLPVCSITDLVCPQNVGNVCHLMQPRVYYQRFYTSHYESAPDYENSWRRIPILVVTHTTWSFHRGRKKELVSKNQMSLHIQMSGVQAHSWYSLQHIHPVINSEGWCWTSVDFRGVTTYTFISLTSTGHQASNHTITLQRSFISEPFKSNKKSETSTQLLSWVEFFRKVQTGINRKIAFHIGSKGEKT